MIIQFPLYYLRHIVCVAGRNRWKSHHQEQEGGHLHIWLGIQGMQNDVRAKHRKILVWNTVFPSLGLCVLSLEPSAYSTLCMYRQALIQSHVLWLNCVCVPTGFDSEPCTLV